MRSGDLECSPHMYKRTVKKKQDRRGRFRTQPVTFMEIKVFDGDLDDFSVLFYPGQASLMVKEAVSPEILNRKVIFVKNVVLPVVFIC